MTKHKKWILVALALAVILAFCAVPARAWAPSSLKCDRTAQLIEPL